MAPPRVALLAFVLLLTWLSRGALAQAANGGVPDSALGMWVLGDDKQWLRVEPQRAPTATFGGGSPNEVKAWTAVLRRATGEGWALLTAVAGYPTDVTLHRGQPILLMSDGSWRTVFAGGSSAGEPPPRGQRLRLIAGEGPALVGYLTGQGGPRLARLERSEWTELGPAPEIGAVADMVVVGDRVVLATIDEQGQVVVRRSSPMPGLSAAATRPATGRSTRPSAVPGLVPAIRPVTWEDQGGFGPVEQGSSRLKVFNLAGELAAWADPGDKAGGTLYKLTGSSWSPLLDLGPVPGELGAAAGRVRFYFGDKQKEKLLEQVFDYSGKKLGEPVTVENGREAVVVDRLSDLVLGLATAGLMLAIVLSWRKRERWTPEVFQAAREKPLAPFGRRFLAGVIDTLPWLAAMGYLVYRGEFTVDVSAWRSMAAVYALLLSYATVVTHTAITEVIFGRTLGMAIAGLKVVDLMGGRPTPGASVIRNLFRAVDMILMLPLIAIVLSPLRQSLGDGAAGTLVVTTDEPDSANMPPQ